MDKINVNNEVNNERVEMTDDELLNSFFKEFSAARQPIADDGFTERVINALPKRQTAASLRRYSLWLNILGGAGILALLIYLGAFTRSLNVLHQALTHIVVSTLSFDYDSLLVQLILFLRRLPEMLPSAPQLAAIAITTIVFMTLGIDRVLRGVRG